MLKILFSLIMLLHGLIHVMGFAKAFHYANITQLSKPVSKPSGVLWLATAILFVIISVLFMLNRKWWDILIIAAAVFSQVLIITEWHDAKWGTIANVVLLCLAILNVNGIIFFE